MHLIDISPTALELSERTLGRLEHISVVGHRATYEEGLRRAAAERGSAATMLVLFLGSNIGNFEPPAAHEFLTEIRGALRPGDALLLGADLVKPDADLIAAYDDPLGVTAAFNKNLLAEAQPRAARGLRPCPPSTIGPSGMRRRGGSRCISCPAGRRRSRFPAPAARSQFAPGETIWTESSYKYTPEEIVARGQQAGFRSRQQWIESDARFALTLFVAE